jgi:hypothetical protein
LPKQTTQNPHYNYEQRIEEQVAQIPSFSFYLQSPAIVPLSSSGKQHYIPEKPSITLARDGRFLRQMQGTKIIFTEVLGSSARLELRGAARAPQPEGKSVEAELLVRSESSPQWLPLSKVTEISTGYLSFQGVLLFADLSDYASQTLEISVAVSSDAPVSKAQVVWDQIHLTQRNKHPQAAESNHQLSQRASHDYEHVFVILLDALRADVVGSYGATYGATPAI